LHLRNADALTVISGGPGRPGIYFSGFETFGSDMYLFLHEMSHDQLGDPNIKDPEERLGRALGITARGDEGWKPAVSRFFNTQCKEKK
jgi:hypothetical protein